jgi:hypothetical protein
MSKARVAADMEKSKANSNQGRKTLSAASSANPSFNVPSSSRFPHLSPSLRWQQKYPCLKFGHVYLQSDKYAQSKFSSATSAQRIQSQ